MGSTTSRKLALVSMVLTVVLGIEAEAADSEGWTVYQEFVAECQEATSMDTLMPFLPEWRKARYERSDKEARKASFDRMCKDAQDLEEIALVKEEASEAETVLSLKASWNGSPMKGRVVLMREGEDLKVEEWSWATGE